MTGDHESSDLTITPICPCCDTPPLGWNLFLSIFSDEDVLPERDSPHVLAVKFTGHRGRSKAAKIDTFLRSVFAILAARGAVRRVDDGFEAPGMILRACANGH